MKMILAATSVFALAALVGCANEDYSDPTAFAEKYLREAVDKRYPVETALKPMRFKGVKLLNVKRELAESFSGTLDRVTCDFEPIPESGVKYYARPGEADKVEPADGISEEEKPLISQPSIASEIQPKLQRLKELLGE